MKNLCKLAGIAVLVAVIGFAVTACDNGTTSDVAPNTAGRLKILGIPEKYEGYYVGFLSDDEKLYGFASINGDQPAYGRINKNGEVTLKVWKKDSDYVDFSGDVIVTDGKIQYYSNNKPNIAEKAITSIKFTAGKAFLVGSDWP